MNKLNVILCGYNWIGCKALDLLLNKEYNVFVYTHSNPPYINSLEELCENRNVPYSKNKIAITNLPFTPDIICSVYYRYIIDEDVINIVKGKIFNIHPSLLPKYRGCSSLTWAIINGEKEVGFTYHYITKDIDKGRILIQKKVEISDWDTQITLYHRVMFEASKYFIEAFNKVLKCEKGISQKGGGRYYQRGCPYDGQININWKIDKIKRFIRAMVYPPLPYSKIKQKEICSFNEYFRFINK